MEVRVIAVSLRWERRIKEAHSRQPTIEEVCCLCGGYYLPVKLPKGTFTGENYKQQSTNPRAGLQALGTPQNLDECHHLKYKHSEVGQIS